MCGGAANMEFYHNERATSELIPANSRKRSEMIAGYKSGVRCITAHSAHAQGSRARKKAEVD